MASKKKVVPDTAAPDPSTTDTNQDAPDAGNTAPPIPDTPVDPPAPPAPPRKKLNYLVNARYDHPHFGGIPMPPGVKFFGFVTVKITEAKPGQGISEKQALAAVNKSLGKDVAGLVIESVSGLPEKW